MKKIIALLLTFCFSAPAYCNSFNDFRECLLNPKKCEASKQQQNDDYVTPKKYITQKTDAVYRDGNGKPYKIGNKKIYYDSNGKITAIDK